MTGQRAPGSPVSPREALAQAASFLSADYEPLPSDDEHTLPLRPRDARLPELLLKLQREQRLFSRTFPLWVVSEVEAPGPSATGAFEYLRPRPFRKAGLRWVGRTGGDHRAWLDRFEGEGLVRGATTMTNVQHLAILWDADERTWILQLSTLAGALIGVGPVNSYAVPFEPADIEGLLTVVRAFARGVGGL